MALSDADHPGKDEVMSSLHQNMNGVLNLIKTLDAKHPIVFVKNMAHHLIEVPKSTFSSYTNVFLTRNPKELIASFCKVIEHPTLVDIGVKAQWDRFKTLFDKGQAPLIVDSGILLQNPKALLEKLCTQLSVDFSDEMLSWEKGPIEEDGSWAKYWYTHVHDSTGFHKPNDEDITLSEHGQRLYEEALPYYEKLSEHAFKL